MSRSGRVVVDRVWKRFRADQRRRLLRDELERIHGLIRRDPSAGWRWVLRDISLEVEPGESVGLVGENGSGKSTLLKVIAGVMFPYAGSVITEGRIGAMIDVKAGLHGELTGRENVLLYGRLLGFRRREAVRRFDEIVAFAELDDAIDRQVKFYSSGMGMRLGFSIAAHLEPELLVVDEVLAVGDSVFQQKCLNRMREVLEQGTTLLYVSHNLATVNSICQRAIWLSDGEIADHGVAEDVVYSYRRSQAAVFGSENDGLAVMKTEARAADGGTAQSGGAADITLTVVSDRVRDVVLTAGITQGEADPIVVVSHQIALPSGESAWRLRFEHLPVPKGRFRIWYMLAEPDAHAHAIIPWRPGGWLRVDGPEPTKPPTGIVRLVPVWVPSSVERVNQLIDVTDVSGGQRDTRAPS
jgi:ABC-type polysaccharide/polyol phosphate transport system ATPase subunit